MNDEYRLRPRLGRPGDRGGARARSYLKRARRAAAKFSATGKPRFVSTGFTGRYIGRGNASAAMARHWSRARSRRVIVKVHIARSTPLGVSGFSKHISYIQREGSGRDGGNTDLYDRGSDIADGSAFNERSQDDRRQFRLIVSAEDAHDLTDQKAFIRDFMDQVETDLDKRLDWIAADHYDTAHPHTHIVIRGGTVREGELVIAKSYITHGFRDRAEALVTDELGLRRFRDLAASRMVQVERDAFTAIDRDIDRLARDHTVRLSSVRNPIERYDRTVLRRRLTHLRRLGLATPIGSEEWALKTDWREQLRALGKRGDLVRTLSAEMGARFDTRNVAAFEPPTAAGGKITGRLSANLPGDELRNGRLIVIDGLDGRRWTHAVTEAETALLPNKGGVLSLSARPARLKPADHTIAKIARANNGIYSDEIHTNADPDTSPAYRLAHKRRLEALRRHQIVERARDGTWTIPKDFEARILTMQARQSGVRIQVESWQPIETLQNARTQTWLDLLKSSELEPQRNGFGAEVRRVAQARTVWLSDQSIDLSSHTTAQRLERQALDAALSDEAKRSGKVAIDQCAVKSFTGLYKRNIDLTHGRFAVVESDTQVTLVKWQPRMANWQGRSVTVSMNDRQVQWTLNRTRGLSR